ncbi:MAG TPA: lyase family protein, partial [Bacteroidales bacterium]|nr:lyase family protein [Bacteroidales bacterium]
MKTRTEKDTMGTVEVPSDRYWGAQTQRSKDNFKIGTGTMPIEIIRAFAILKKAAALANFDLGVLPAEKRDVICQVCDEIYEGKL